jgi:drug/metabolite transporter (DMT)-like permease
MNDTTRRATWKVLLAFGIIYFVWGSTFLAIRVGVQEVPPFLLAGMRFVLAGAVLYAWMRTRGTASPTSRDWTLRLGWVFPGRERRASRLSEHCITE